MKFKEEVFEELSDAGVKALAARLRKKLAAPVDQPEAEIAGIKDDVGPEEPDRQVLIKALEKFCL